ncbi:unnamed protein product, partial [marine sediment metagenome]
QIVSIVIAVMEAVAVVAAVVGGIVEAVGALVYGIGEVVVGIGQAMAMAGEGWMAFGGLGEGGLMAAGFNTMAVGGLGNFIVGAAMVVAGAAIYVAGAVMWVAGQIVTAAGELIKGIGKGIQQFGKDMAKGAKTFRTGGADKLVKNLFDLNEWGWGQPTAKLGFKAFMHNLATVSRIYSAVQRTTTFVKNVREHGFGTALKNLGIQIAASVAADYVYNKLAFAINSFAPEGGEIIPFTASWDKDTQSFSLSTSIMDKATLGWSSVASMAGGVSLEQSRGIVA